MKERLQLFLRKTPVILAWAVIGWVCLAPVGYLLVVSFIPEGTPGLVAYEVLLDGRVLVLFLRSLILALAATLVAFLLGGTAAALVETRRVPLRGALRVTALTPLVLPPFVVVLACQGGLRWLRLLLDLEPSALSLSGSLPACVVLLGISFSPLSFFFTSQGLRGVSRELADAAMIARRPWLVWRRVLLPLSAPSLVVGCAMTFVLAFLNFEIPYLLEIPTYPVEITLEHGANEPGRAFALAAPAVLITLIALWGVHRWAARRGFALSGRETAAALQRRPAGLLTWSFLLFWWGIAVGFPVVFLIVGVRELPVMTRNYLEFQEHILFGVLLPLSGALLAVGLAAAVARPGQPRAAALVLWLPFALPGALLSFGLIRLWNRPPLDGVYDSPFLLVLGTAARFFPVAYFALMARLLSVPADYWEAGKLLVGRRPGRWRKLARAYGPLAAPGMILGAATVFLLQSGELSATLQLQHPGLTPITVVIYNKLHLYREQDVAALCLYHLVAVLGVTALLLLCGRIARRVPERTA